MSIEELIGKTLEYEGGFTNNPADSGNWTGANCTGELKGTNFGICARQYPSLDIKNLSKEMALQIYKRDYFDRANLGLITNPDVAWKIFDMGVNQGTGTAVRLLQQVVGEREDGLLGIKTANLANAMNSDDLLKQLATKQILRYADIVSKDTSQIQFLKGWIRRAMDY